MTLPALLLALGAASGDPEFVSLSKLLESEPTQYSHAWDVMDPPSLFEHGLGPWPVGATLAQGYFGVYYLDRADVSGGSFPPINGDDYALATLPSTGGGFQYKLGGTHVSWGLEAMIDFAGRADALAFYSSGGGALIAVDIDLASFGLGGGPFVSVFLGSRWRAYAAGGGLMHWAWYDQQGSTTADTGNGDGFGTGWYTRAGIEFLLPDHATLLGIGGRWSQSVIDISGGFGNIELEGTQVLMTITRSL